MRRLLSHKSTTVVVVSLFLLVPIGCGGKEGPKKLENPEASSGTSEGTSARAPLEGPAAAVHAFLEGARRGDDRAVAAMFTEKARKELDAIGLEVAPKASDTARFEVGEVQVSGENESVALVSSTWTEVDPTNNESTSDEIVWALRKVSADWRIAGMAVTIFPGEPRWAFNFESRDELQAQGMKLNAEKKRRAKAAEATALGPDTTPTR